MKSIQKIFRNPASDTLLMLGFVISCIIIINISNLVSKISIEDQSTDVFKNHLVVGVKGETSPENLQHFVELIDNIPEGNAFYNTYVTLERQADTYGAELVMQDNESLLFSLKKGGYNKKMNYTNAVIIGETFEKYVVTENGQKVIYFDRNRYEVIGVLENHMVAGIDKSLYIFGDTLEESLKAYHLQNNRMSFPYFKSNLDTFSAIDSVIIQFKRFTVTVLLVAVSLIVFIFAIILYQTQSQGYHSFDEVLNYGVEQTGLLEIQPECYNEDLDIKGFIGEAMLKEEIAYVGR